MAKAKANKMINGKSMGVGLPECPVCFETMSAPIFQCRSGHSLCSQCNSNLSPAICPICRQALTQMRNWQLEDVISKAKVSCSKQGKGVHTMNTQNVAEHLKERKFGIRACQVGVVFGNCSWKGKIKDMLQHCEEQHPEHCNINTDSDVELDNISITDDDQHVFLIGQGTMLFIVTVKIDVIQKIAYWIVQYIGTRKIAQQHVYEIRIISKQECRRTAVFYECCFNDALKPDQIVRLGKCSIIPLTMLSHFIKDRKLLFRISIKKISVSPNEKVQQNDGVSGNTP